MFSCLHTLIRTHAISAVAASRLCPARPVCLRLGVEEHAMGCACLSAMSAYRDFPGGGMYLDRGSRLYMYLRYCVHACVVMLVHTDLSAS